MQPSRLVLWALDLEFAVNEHELLLDSSPAWCWDVIRSMVHGERVPARTDEEWLRKGVRFLRRWKSSKPWDLPRLKADFPGLCDAYTLYSNPKSIRWII